MKKCKYKTYLNKTQQKKVFVIFFTCDNIEENYHLHVELQIFQNILSYTIPICVVVLRL